MNVKRLELRALVRFRDVLLAATGAGKVYARSVCRHVMVDPRQLTTFTTKHEYCCQLSEWGLQSPVEAGTDHLAVGRTDHSLVNGM